MARASAWARGPARGQPDVACAGFPFASPGEERPPRSALGLRVTHGLWGGPENNDSDLQAAGRPRSPGGCQGEGSCGRLGAPARPRPGHLPLPPGRFHLTNSRLSSQIRRFSGREDRGAELSAPPTAGDREKRAPRAPGRGQQAGRTHRTRTSGLGAHAGAEEPRGGERDKGRPCRGGERPPCVGALLFVQSAAGLNSGDSGGRGGAVARMAGICLLGRREGGKQGGRAAARAPEGARAPLSARRL